MECTTQIKLVHLGADVLSVQLSGTQYLRKRTSTKHFGLSEGCQNSKNVVLRYERLNFGPIQYKQLIEGVKVRVV